MDLENILNTIQPFLVLFVAVFAAFLTATWISSVIWAFRDIRARTRDIFAQVLATLMVLIFFPLFPVPGLALYLMLRPRETLAEVYERQLEEEALLKGIEERLACPSCNRRIETDFMVCPSCHTRLKKPCLSCNQLLHLRWNICPYCGAAQTMAQPVILPPEEAESPMLGMDTPSQLRGLVAEGEADVGLLGEGEESARGSLAHDEAAAAPFYESQPTDLAGTEDMPESEASDDTVPRSIQEHLPDGELGEVSWWDEEGGAEPETEGEAGSEPEEDALPF